MSWYLYIVCYMKKLNFEQNFLANDAMSVSKLLLIDRLVPLVGKNNVVLAIANSSLCNGNKTIKDLKSPPTCYMLKCL